MGKIYGCGTNYKKYWGGLLTTKVTSVRRPAYQDLFRERLRIAGAGRWQLDRDKPETGNKPNLKSLLDKLLSPNRGSVFDRTRE